MTFCQSQPAGYDGIRGRARGPDGPAEVIWRYLEPTEVAFDRTGTAPRGHLIQSVEVSDPHQEVFLSGEQSLEREFPSPDAAGRLVLASDVERSQPPTPTTTASR